jgi:uncharacterized protein YyaL (SSP411 family)
MVKILSKPKTQDSLIPKGKSWFCFLLVQALKSTLVFSMMVFLCSDASAYDHQHSKVKFLDYSAAVMKEHKNQKKPIFLLFSAEWCHWCKVLQNKTLKEKRVYEYLNQHFVNVFIDADIHNGAYLKYKATGVPFTVFLNPNYSVYFKYSGVLYADDFLEVLRGVQENVAIGKNLYGDEDLVEVYQPPEEFGEERLETLDQMLRDGVLDNIDWKYAGLGQGEKTIHPLVSLYLLEYSKGEEREQHLEWITSALDQAIEQLYDPIEGGFYRYAETREWQVPHFEKMADLNAGMVALLEAVNHENPSPKWKKTADQTLGYLIQTLYSQESGVFHSFQEADTFYYFLNREGREEGKAPPVIQRVFTDRLSRTLLHLMELRGTYPEFELEPKIRSSLDFLSNMVIRKKQVFHFHDLNNGQWETPGSLEDLVLLTIVFAEAAKKYKQPHYLHALKKLHRHALEHYYDPKRKIFVDPNLNPDDDLEFHLEMNAWLALSFLTNPKPKPDDQNRVREIIRYFSAVGVRLEDHLWDSQDWYFTDHYTPFLKVARNFR